MKKYVLFLVLLFSVFLTSCSISPIDKVSEDALNFSLEYDIAKDNVFKYKTDKQIINILKNETGIIYFGFPECPWCKKMMPLFHEALKEKKIKEVFYLNPKDIRIDNTKEYKEIVELLKDYLAEDKEGNKRLYVPEVIIVKNGKILGNNKELSKINNISGNTEEYFTKEKSKEIKNSFIELFEKLYSVECDKC